MNDPQHNREVHTLHRYFIWASAMRVRFEQQLRDDGAPRPDEVHLYPWMAYWYASLYAVVEGWRKLDLRDDDVDRLLTDADKLSLLRRYRNGVFHFQRKYHDDRLVGLIAEGRASAQWIRDLHDALDRWFLAFFGVDGGRAT